MLSKENKFFIWKTKLNSLKNSPNLNASQKEFVQELISTLKIEYFEENVLVNHPHYYNVYLKEMKRIGNVLFTSDQMFLYFSKIEDVAARLPESGGDGGGELKSCNCSSSDDWCVGSATCFVWSCERHTGCGWWLKQECNGLCATNN